jgi:hypothetical protein
MTLEKLFRYHTGTIRIPGQLKLMKVTEGFGRRRRIYYTDTVPQLEQPVYYV